MNKDGILTLARNLLEANPNTLNNPDGYLTHLSQVHDLARDVVENIHSKYKLIPLILEEVSLAAGLHDIGRPLQKDQTFHELRGAKYIEENGLTKMVAPYINDVYRIAQIFIKNPFKINQFL